MSISQSFQSSSRESSASSASVGKFSFESEEDDIVRPCTVYLYIKKSVGGPAHHWALYFDWRDYSVTYDANNEGDTLTPMWNKGQPINLEGTSSEMKKLGERSISPQHVNQLAEKNTLSGSKYSLSKNNCQHWAQQLARKLNLKIQMGEVATIVGCAVGGGAVLGSLSAVSSAQANKK